MTTHSGTSPFRRERAPISLALFAGLGLVFASPALAGEPRALLQQPTVSKDRIVFVHATDLWSVARNGGAATRLTATETFERSPALSPDGRRLAWSSDRAGRADVYVMELDSGATRRLTWHPGSDRVQGWSSDGKDILFTSARDGADPVARLYAVSVEGGPPRALPVPRASHVSAAPGGGRVAYTPYSDAFRTWKRYRGGRVTEIWIQDLNTAAVEVLPRAVKDGEKPWNDSFPVWLGDTVYYGSDRSGVMNLWRWSPKTRADPERLTDFKDFHLRSLATGGGVVVLERADGLRVFDPESGRCEAIRVEMPTAGLALTPHWVSVKGHVHHADISPSGARAVFEARGEIITVPREDGAPRNLSESPAAHDRHPVWSPDGASIAWLSDRSGEVELLVRDARGREPARRYRLGEASFYYELTWSPDTKRIAFSDKSGRLGVVTLRSSIITEVETDGGSLGVVLPSPVWSPDSRLIAFEGRDKVTGYDTILLYDMTENAVASFSDGFSSMTSPSFSPDGRYLFFAATVDSGPKRFGLDLNSSAAADYTMSLYVAVLHADEPSPLLPKSDDEDGAEAKPKKDKTDKAAKRPKRRTGVDLEGLRDRILALPLPAQRYSNLAATDKGLLFIERDRAGGRTLKAFSWKARKAKPVGEKVRGFALAAGGKHLLVRTARTWEIRSLDGKQKNVLAIDAVKVKRDPAAEWRQILREAWRLHRDFFYDTNMHGVDWPAMWTRWSALLPHVRHRAELTVLLEEMVGELACGHAYVSGGDLPRARPEVPVGLLGADLVPDQGRWRIAKIYRGQSWNPGLRAPLVGPGLDIKEGDLLMAVNGEELRASQNLFQAFENLAEQRVELTIVRDEAGEPRTVTVVPVKDDSALRRRAEIERRRAMVAKLSGGKLGYIYLPDTAGGGLAAFRRDFFSQLDKQGLVIDERFNRGGKVADYFIERLSREVFCYWMNRERWLGRTPFATIPGPKVMIINERAGSGGDALPWLFRRQKLGKLVGRRTWGGLVGISSIPRLMDGGRVTVPSFGVMDTEGDWAVENVGVAPDIEVVQWPAEVLKGRDPQLEKAVEVALEELEAQKTKPTPTFKPPAKR